MDEKTFWNLGLYDWSLWIEKIKFDNQKSEMEWVRLSHLQALLAEINRNQTKRPNSFKPTDFYIPSWDTEKEQVIDNRTDEEILSQFPKKFNEVKNGK